MADDLGISFGWFSKVKNGATPSRALVSNVARLHKEYFSSPVQETVQDGRQDYKPGESTVDLPAETMELAQAQVAASAVTCPHCGGKLKRRNRDSLLLAGLGIMLLMLGLIALGALVK